MSSSATNPTLGVDPLKKAKRERNPNEIGKKANFLINVFFWLYTAACVLPLFLVIAVSFSNERDVVVDGYKFIPQTFSLDAYRFLFEDWTPIVNAYGVSIFVTVVGTILSVILMSLYAYPISRDDFPHKNFFSFFCFFTLLFNGGLVPFYLVYTQTLDLKNSLWALIMPYLVGAFWVLIIRTFFKTTIPVALLEAAKIDGASEFRIFGSIVLPLSMPVLATVALFQTLVYWNDWFMSLLYITKDTNVSVQFLMYKTMLNIQFLSTNTQAAAGIAAGGGILSFPTETVRMAMAVVGVGPIIFAYPFFQRFFIQGLTVGAVKG